MVKGASIRQQKKETTRTRLVDVATRLFIQKGFDNTTIDEIVREAEVSQRTFFRHFPSKEGIVFANVKGRHNRFRQLLDEKADTVDPFERIKSTLIQSAGEYDGIRESMLNEYKMISTSRYLKSRDMDLDYQLEKLMASTLMYHRGSRYLSKNQARIAAASILGAVRVLMEDWLDKDCRHSLKRHTKLCLSVVDMLAVGFAEQNAGTGVHRSSRTTADS